MIPYRVNASGNGEYWKSLKLCEFGISPGAPYHYGPKFASMVDWASKRFDSGIITLSDTLYRHNIAPPALAESDAAWEKSRALGDEWFAINKETLETYAPFIGRIYRWDEWLAHPEYKETRAKLQAYYESCFDFRAVVDADSFAFAEKKAARGLAPNMQDAINGSRAFLMEEMAVYNIIGAEMEIARIYPSRCIPCFDYLRRPDVPQDLRYMTKTHHVGISLMRKVSTLQDAA